MAEYMERGNSFGAHHVLNLMPKDLDHVNNVDSLYKNHFLLRSQRGLGVVKTLGKEYTIVYNRLTGGWKKSNIPVFFFTQESTFDVNRIAIGLKIFENLNASDSTGDLINRCYLLVRLESEEWQLSLLNEWKTEIDLNKDYGVLLERLYTPCPCNFDSVPSDKNEE